METKSRQHFDSSAKNWDDSPGRLELASSLFSALGEEVPIHAEMHALDYGCGTGLVTLPLASQIATVTAADTSEEMLKVLAGKAEKAGITGLTPLLLTEDLQPQFSSPFDLIVSTMVFHHIRDIPAMIRRFADWLADDGLIAIADLEPEDGTFHSRTAHPVHLGIDPSWLSKHLKEVGLAVRTIREVHTIIRKPEGADDIREYPVFLLVGRKEAAS